MAYGQVPYKNLDPNNIQEAITTKPYTFKESSSEDFKSMLRRCFESNPINRATAEELLSHRFFMNAPDIDYIKASFSHILPPTLPKTIPQEQEQPPLQPVPNNQAQKTENVPVTIQTYPDHVIQSYTPTAITASTTTVNTNTTPTYLPDSVIHTNYSTHIHNHPNPNP